MTKDELYPGMKVRLTAQCLKETGLFQLQGAEFEFKRLSWKGMTQVAVLRPLYVKNKSTEFTAAVFYLERAV